MQTWIAEVFGNQTLGLMALPAALLFGMLSLAGSPCNIAVLAVVTGYAGSREVRSRGEVLFSCAALCAGSVLALSALGAVMGYLGYLAGGTLGFVGTLAIGLLAVVLGLSTLGLVPFKIPMPKLSMADRFKGRLGAVAFGATVGMAGSTCAAGCGPALPLVLGTATLKGQPLFGAALLASFAIGYALPIAAVMLGAGMGRLATTATAVAKPARYVAGAVLVCAGFWILTSA